MADPIIEKIRKLQALADRAGTEAEAAAAATMVMELLAKHNLEIGEVVLREDPGATVMAGKSFRRTPAHAPDVARACADLFDVLFYFGGGRFCGWRFAFIGVKANAEAAALTYEYLAETIDALARGMKAQDLIYGPEDFQHFRCGAACRIREMATARKQQTVASNPGYAQLVHVTKALAQSLYDEIKFAGSRGGGWGAFFSGGTTAYKHGYEQAGRIDLHGARTSRMLK